MAVSLSTQRPADTQDANSVVTRQSPPLRLEFLDGIRGLAAFYVVLHHAYMELHYRYDGGGIPERVFRLLKFLDFGHYAVDIFIVLSGYCLMLPVARAADGRLRGGFWPYLIRRARRILPPYYAALACSFLLLWLARVLDPSQSASRSDWRADFTSGSVLAHLLLLHNLTPDYAFTVNPPMWSVATEWQIYFLFPLLLLPVWRRFGTFAAVLGGFAVGLMPHYLLHGLFDKAALWFIGLFALGMAGAVCNFSPAPALREKAQRVPWWLLSGLLWVAFVLFGLLKSGWYKDHRWLADPLVGLAAMCLMVSCVQHLLTEDRPPTAILRVLDSRFSRWLGAFSYSLYLIHFPLLSVFDLLFLRLSLPPMARVSAVFMAAVPLTVGVAYLLYLGVERHFQSAPRARRLSEPTLGG